MEQKKIYEVAVYLRKSRDDTDGEEDVLLKHETALTDFVKKNNWRYVIYREIGSSDSIDFRPEFKRLLKDVENDFYDAVVVMDYDRLSRGDKEDRARVEKILKLSNTLVVTPTRVYDLNDEDQELITDIEGVFARYEYRMIKKRFQRGKKIGARLGHWTNGPAPFPYLYNSEARSLEPDPEKLDIYNFIKQRLLSGATCAAVCWELNRMGVPSPKGKLWQESVLYRLALNEVHLGRIVYGKTSGGLHKNRKTAPFRVNPRENWVIVENAHPAVKTPEEHAEILKLLEQRRIQSKRTRHGTYVYSGLVYCGKCGSSRQFQPKDNGTLLVKKCQKIDPYGNRCGNPGADLVHIELAVMESLRDYEEEIRSKPIQTSDSPDMTPQMVLKLKETELETLHEGLNRLKDIYVSGDLTKQEYRTRLGHQKDLIMKKENDIQQLKETLQVGGPISDQDRLQRIEQLQEVWKQLDCMPEEKNRLLKQIIERIEYVRDNYRIDVRVKFR
ncbi:recombinase family protein [Ferroacidibacillus organovorans]|uniref:Recombinase family protein n=1 Tax=Ferroacidibacillus organovorans TaxID=1765683 RepID=A0A124IVZ5_9BACL|nr:recombinase family protein [Ferroacidibacillus organovorans]KUO95796.1 hypothetical protein ATW55_14980 [Ferroacidibacillus organovorans]